MVSQWFVVLILLPFLQLAFTRIISLDEHFDGEDVKEDRFGIATSYVYRLTNKYLGPDLTFVSIVGYMEDGVKMDSIQGLGRSRPNTPSKPNEIKIWVQFEGYQATRVTLDYTSIIDDLIGVALNGEGRRNEYQAHYRNRELGPGERIPSDTESDHPVVLRKIIIRPPRDPNPTGPKPDTLKDYHIVIDNSNVFLGAQTIRNEKTGVPQMNPAIRVEVKNLAKVLEEDKVSVNVRTRVVG
ncbi:unnamed protein product [Adineta steineri]|uniref:Uncharacterized protein n=1 Tax=Adineta steineri TaxID=433720 RepID=A0A813RAG3_9BILA|nr:unnamed protein product [Adineta steineri]